MYYKNLGRTGLKVSRCCLGTMMWGGGQNTESYEMGALYYSHNAEMPRAAPKDPPEPFDFGAYLRLLTPGMADKWRDRMLNIHPSLLPSFRGLNTHERALAAGVARESIVIDPAHDFGKNTFHSLEVTRRIQELVATGWPVLVSLSNKDFVGETLGLEVGERLVGTLAATAVCALAGARIYRVHQVVETRQAVDMVWSVAGRRPPSRAIRGLQ